MQWAAGAGMASPWMSASANFNHPPARHTQDCGISEVGEKSHGLRLLGGSSKLSESDLVLNVAPSSHLGCLVVNHATPGLGPCWSGSSYAGLIRSKVCSASCLKGRPQPDSEQNQV